MRSSDRSRQTTIDAVLGSPTCRALLGLCISLLLVVALARLPVYTDPNMVGWGPSGYDPLLTFQDIDLQEDEADEAEDEGDSDPAAEIPVTASSTPAPDESPPADDALNGAGGDGSESDASSEEEEDGDDAKQVYELGAEGEAPSIRGGYRSLYLNIDYPEAARRSGIEGRVILDFTVDRQGQTHQIEVIQPLHPLTDSAAVRAVRSTRFTPGTVDGDPIPVRLQLPIRFELLGIEASTAGSDNPP